MMGVDLVSLADSYIDERVRGHRVAGVRGCARYSWRFEFRPASAAQLRRGAPPLLQSVIASGEIVR